MKAAAVVLVLVASLAVAQVAGVCGPGKACAVRSLDYGRPRASFEACTSSVYGRTIVDLDAGVIRMCQTDGGWSDVAGGGGGSSGSYWYDGGVGYITSTESPSFIGAGGFLDQSINGPAAYVSRQSYNGSTLYPPIRFIDSFGTVKSEITESAFGGTSIHVGLNIRYSGMGDTPITFSSIGLNRRFGAFGGADSPYGLFLPAPSGQDAIVMATNGARIHLGTGSTDYIASDGTNTVVAGGVKLGGTSATTIGGSYAATWRPDGGSISAGYCYEQQIAVTGATPPGDCVVTNPQTSQTTGIMLDCTIQDSNVARVRICNTDNLAPLAPVDANYRVRVFNP